jgi:hypothetical protein
MSINLNTTIVTTTPYTIAGTDEVVLVNVANAAAVTLPAVTVSDTGLAFYIKDISGDATVNPITISAPGNVLVDGTAFALLNRGYSHIQVIYDGTNWEIIA